jgi:exopolyphosphatase/pppGpp-phosphohydrolase
MDNLYSFITSFCAEFNIDESHDVRHSKDCVSFLTQIMDESFTAEERHMATYAAALHDCVDRKYVDETTASQRILAFLTGIGWGVENATALLAMITTMSYSKLKAKKINGASVYPDHGKWDRVYHVVRQADLLCSYRVHRCYQYQKRIHPEWSEDAHWRHVEALFQERMFKYVVNRWFSSRQALALIPVLIQQAQVDLSDRVGTAPPTYMI